LDDWNCFLSIQIKCKRERELRLFPKCIRRWGWPIYIFSVFFSLFRLISLRGGGAHAAIRFENWTARPLLFIDLIRWREHSCYHLDLGARWRCNNTQSSTFTSGLYENIKCFLIWDLGSVCLRGCSCVLIKTRSAAV
jgi:hypothetical protein